MSPPPRQVEHMFRQALTLHQQARLAEAEAGYLGVLKLHPAHAESLRLLGLIGLQQNQPLRAAQCIEAALRIDPRNAAAHHDFGMALCQLKLPERALQSFNKALALNPSHVGSLYHRGQALLELSRTDAALASLEAALVIKPQHALALYSRGNVLQSLGRFAQAIASYDECLRLNPVCTDAHYNRGNALLALGRCREAIDSYDRTLAIDPKYVSALVNRGSCERRLHRFSQALTSFDAALALTPGDARAHNNRGNVLREMRRFGAAHACFERALALDPKFADAHCNVANTLHDERRLGEALLEFQRALMLKESPEALAGMAGILDELGRPGEAGPYFDRALSANARIPGLRGARLLARMKVCHWDNLSEEVRALNNCIEAGELAATPLSSLTLPIKAPLRQVAAQLLTQLEYPASDELGTIEGPRAEGRIRVGYFSADFRDHPVSRLLVEVLESHDKERFEVSGFGWGEKGAGPLSERVRGAFEHFIDVQERSDLEVAKLARQMGLDVAVDLGGFTQGCRPRIFALRAAPVQVSYLGYLGTLGAPYMDYLLADETLIPESHQQHYQEKIVYLPSYQANDSKRELAAREFSREELGLPPEGFVYCCFNASCKITPKIFDSWMRIVSAVEGSVLYLYAGDAPVQQRLRAEAQRRGVSGKRLVFGPTLPVPEYLARYRAADLFLDTLPYNAGTTASDALWAGLPVLTCLGESFAGRMAGSLLHALELPELITENIPAYEARAIELARDPQQLRTLREKLKRQRSTARLFDTERFTRVLEQAFTLMHTRCRDGLPASHLHVA